MADVLKSLRVVEVSGIGPGPFAAMMLADLGASVTAIVRPGEVPMMARGKEIIELDLKTQLDDLLEMIPTADVFIEGFRPGVAERLGFGPEVLHEINPKLVYGRMTGWGQDGPLAKTAGHDINYIAISGALDSIGRAGEPPIFPVNYLGDFAGGSIYLVAGILASLIAGGGQVVDAAIVDGVAHLQSMTLELNRAGLWNFERGTNLLDSGAPFYDVYETSDGKYLSVGALEEKFWVELISILQLEVPDRAEQKNWPEIRNLLTEKFKSRTRDEWTEVFFGTDACVAPVLSLEEAAQFSHNQARNTFGPGGAAPAPRFC